MIEVMIWKAPKPGYRRNRLIRFLPRHILRTFVNIEPDSVRTGVNRLFINPATLKRTHYHSRSIDFIGILFTKCATYSGRSNSMVSNSPIKGRTIKSGE
jgi:hypothetical protein